MGYSFDPPAAESGAQQTGYSFEPPAGAKSKRQLKLTTPTEELKKETAKMSGTQKFLTGIGGGMTDFVTGLKQAGAVAGNKLGLVKPETVKRITDEGTADRQLMNTLQTGESWYGPAHVGEFIGQTAPLATLPGGMSGKLLKRAGTAALAGAGVGATQFVPEGGSRGVNTLMGAGIGAAVPAAIRGGQKVVEGIKNIKAKGLPFSDKSRQARAGQQLNTVMRPFNTRDAAVIQARQAETEALHNRLKPTTKTEEGGTVPVYFSKGQESNAYKPKLLENRLMTHDPEFATRVEYNDAEIRKAATKNLRDAVGEAKVFPTVQSASDTGANIVKTLKFAQEPVLAAEKGMWKEVPTYEMPAGSTEAAFKSAMAEPSMADDTVKKMYDVYRQYRAQGSMSVQKMQTLERKIGNAMKAGDAETASMLRPVKEAVAADFEKMGEAAVKGDVALHNGKIVYPSELRTELSRVEDQLTAAQTAPMSLKEQNAHLFKYLAGKGESVMQNTGVSDAMYAKSLADRLKYVEGKGQAGDWQPLAADTQAPNQATAGLEARRTALTDQLANLQPAEDVAAKYLAAKSYSHTEKFKRFFRGSVQDVLESGDQASGQNLRDELVPDRLFTQTGIRDTIRSLSAEIEGPGITKANREELGRYRAAETMMPHVVRLLRDQTMNANTGAMRIPDAAGFLQKYGPQLKTLGLNDAVDEIIRGQVPRAIEEEFKRRAVDKLGSPQVTAHQARALIKEFGPQVERLMGGAKGTQALEDWGKTMEVLGRNKQVNIAGGSDTQSKGKFVVAMAEKIATVLAVMTAHGWVWSASKGAAKGVIEEGVKHNTQGINALLENGLYNPPAAEALLKVFNAPKKQIPMLAEKYLRPLLVGMQAEGKIARQPNAPPEEATDDATP
jgi:hypothetical protein